MHVWVRGKLKEAVTLSVRLSNVTRFLFLCDVCHPLTFRYRKTHHGWNPAAPGVHCGRLELLDTWWVYSDSHLGLWGSDCATHILPRPHPGLVAPGVSACLATHSCPTLCGSPGSPVHGAFQARTLEWVAISFSRGIFPTQR